MSKKAGKEPQGAQEAGAKQTPPANSGVCAPPIPDWDDALFRLALQSVSDSITLTTVEDGRYRYVNEAFCRATGYAAQDVIGRTPIELGLFVDPVDREQFVQQLRDQGTVDAYPMQYRMRDGVILDTLLSVRRVRYNDEDCLVAAVKDITAFNRSEKERARLTTKLLEAQKMEAIGRLAGGIAHEFNNSLMTIAGNIELLEVTGSVDSSKIDHLDPIKASIRRMEYLTMHLLAYARGGLYQAMEVGWNGFLQETLLLLRHRLAPPVSLVLDLEDSGAMVEIDATQMQMVLSAILSNAADAMEEHGEIRIVSPCHEAPGEVADYTGAKIDRPGVIGLAVSDTGKGMNQQTLDRVFEPFFTTKSHGGGLGMAAVYGIVKNHNGWISVESTPGRGTVVKVFLPVVGWQEDQARKRPQTPVTGTGTVLLIDDEALVLDVYQELLEHLGYRVLRAGSGREAIDISAGHKEPIDIAILDLHLADVAAIEVFHRLLARRPELKVLVASSGSFDTPAQELLAAGAQDFIQKPYSLASISERLRSLTPPGPSH